MVRTFRRHWPRFPKGDYKARCSICGAKWPRSKLTRSWDGLYLCPHDQEKTVAELTRDNAAAAARRYMPSYGSDAAAGGYDLEGPQDFGIPPGEHLELCLATEDNFCLLTEAGEEMAP